MLSRAKVLKPAPKISLVEWADTYRHLSKEASAEPGRWRTSRIEVARGPMEAITDPAVEKVSIMAPTQLLKTEMILNVVGYFIHQDPAPILVIQPTVEMAEAWSKDRLGPMLRDSPSLNGLVNEKKKESGNKILHKPLAIDTPIPTIEGFKTMGDISVGDFVFDERGNPCRVSYVTPIMKNKECFEIEFSDGTKVVSDSEHPWPVQQWKVIKKPKPKSVIVESIKSTIDLSKDYLHNNGNRRYSIKHSDPIDPPEIELPIDPYVLGCWLGDGYSHKAAIVKPKKDIDIIAKHFVSSGLDINIKDLGKICELNIIDEPTKRSPITGKFIASSNSFLSKLSNLGLLSNAGKDERKKQIPENYFFSSKKQRLSLLQGLMDTDGSCRTDGWCVFSTTTKELAYGVLKIVKSMGIPASFVNVPEPINTNTGKIGRPAYRIEFTPPDTMPVFRLPRKKQRQRPQSVRGSRRQIVSIKKVKSVPVRCISVDTENHLFLCTESYIPTHNTFAGGQITMVGANAPGNLAMRPIRILLMDEIDKYPESAGREGDPIKLATERTATFWNRKIVHVCSPTIEGLSRIEQEYFEGDQRIFLNPCPHCQSMQEMKWEYVEWPDDEPEKAQYHCRDCKKPWTERQRLRSIQKGHYEATADFNGHASFRCSKLVSPWEPITKIAKKYEESKDKPEQMKTFINTQLARTFKEAADVPDWRRLYERREDYKLNVIPKDAIFVTAGVDCQGDRLECEIVAWGSNKQSWSIDYRVIQGRPQDEETWEEFDKLVGEMFEAEGQKLPRGIDKICVDSGYATTDVYSFTSRHPKSRVICVKGSDTYEGVVSVPKAVDINRQGKVVRRGTQVRIMGSSYLKGELYGWLKKDAPLDGEADPYGFCHFPMYGDDYFKMLTAEEIRTKIVNGYPKRQWEKIRDRNESLDCRVMARAAASICGLDRIRKEKLDTLKAKPIRKETSSIVNANNATNKKTRKRRDSSFL